MVEISASREISAPLDRIWDIVSDMNSESRYWSSLNAASNISKNGYVIEREEVVEADFGNSAKTLHHQTLISCPKKSIQVALTEGPMIGSRVITLSPCPASNNNNNSSKATKVDVSWEVKLSDIPLLFRGMARKHIVQVTEEALDRIARAV